MGQEMTLTALNEIFKNVFEDNSIQLTKRTTTADIESWDSLNHIQMITAVEKHFKIRFELKELLTLQDVGDLLNAINAKIPQ